MGSTPIKDIRSREFFRATCLREVKNWQYVAISNKLVPVAVLDNVDGSGAVSGLTGCELSAGLYILTHTSMMYIRLAIMMLVGASMSRCTVCWIGAPISKLAAGGCIDEYTV